MTSVVTDVLNSAGVLAKEDIASKVENLKVKIEDIKIEVQESLKNRYIDFIPQYVKFEKLVNSLNSVKSEYDVLVHQIEKEIRPQMTNAVVEYREMQDDLKRINCLKVTVLQLIELHKYLETAKNALSQKFYMEANENLLIFKEKCKEINIESQKDIEIIYALNIDYVDTLESLIFQLSDIWKQKVSINQLEGNKRCKYHVDIGLKTVSMDNFSDVIHALEATDELKNVLKFFGRQFLDIVCRPIMTEEVEIKLVSGDKTVITLLVLKHNGAPDPKAVFQHLMELFRMLHTLLFNWSVIANDENSLDTLMRRLGALISDEFCNMLVEKCIKPAVPVSSRGLESFQKAIDHVINLQNLLKELGFFTSQENPLMEFIQDIDELPANKMALDLLSKARDLMKQDLYQTKVVGIEKSSSHEILKPDQAGELNQMARTKSGLSKASFAFPACQISIFAKSLVDLLHEVMREAKNLHSQSEVYSLKLFYTARNICDLYCCIIPTFHKDAITNIPQQTAIHHNNCMYIAHDLLTLGLQYDLQSSFPVTFVDLASELKRIGTEAFLAQMRNQRQQLLQMLQDEGAFQSIGQDENLLNKAEKTVHQCLNHLQLLKRVWSDVLPLEVYFKAMGTLMNTFMEEIILRVISMEDIVAQTSSQLDSVFGIVLMQSPDLFKVTREDRSDIVHNYVHRWFKFQELQLVLSASLVEIVDRWSSSKGPLATHFTAEEIKHLIRALFQNTERRAAALGKIR